MGIGGIGKRRDWSEGGIDAYHRAQSHGTPDDEGAVLHWTPEEKRKEFKELQQSIDLNNARKERDQLEKELRGAQMVIDDLRARNNIAQHDTFKAEVEMRRAQKKRRNQKLELKRLHNAVNEKNNRIRNLELEIGELRGAK